jgi:hypothetical protein
MHRVWHKPVLHPMFWVLGMAWEIAFQPPDTLTLDTRGWVFRLGTAHVPLPDWLWPWTLGRADTVQRADVEADRVIHIELVIRHALFGDMFGYSGTFKIL